MGGGSKGESVGAPRFSLPSTLLRSDGTAAAGADATTVEVVSVGDGSCSAKVLSGDVSAGAAGFCAAGDDALTGAGSVFGL
jgi:hypothetical protein